MDQVLVRMKRTDSNRSWCSRSRAGGREGSAQRARGDRAGGGRGAGGRQVREPRSELLDLPAHQVIAPGRLRARERPAVRLLHRLPAHHHERSRPAPDRITRPRAAGQPWLEPGTRRWPDPRRRSGGVRHRPQCRPRRPEPRRVHGPQRKPRLMAPAGSSKAPTWPGARS